MQAVEELYQELGAVPNVRCTRLEKARVVAGFDLGHGVCQLLLELNALNPVTLGFIIAILAWE